MGNPLARLPAVHRLLAHPDIRAAVARHGRESVRDAVRLSLTEARRAAQSGGEMPEFEAIARATLARLEARANAAYPAVINATGVLIHTNLGRSPLAAESVGGYLALEFDLEHGGRGERLAPIVERLTRYFGADAATVVTNNAAALVLLLAAHAAGRDVLVSRGELIEIGGSFRLPEIMVAAGAKLVEVGTTNRTRARDYELSLNDATAAILVVHRSNFRIEGFVESPPLGELVALGRSSGVPVWVDQGSGCHLDLARYGMRHETTVQEIVTGGADAVLFSGDKLLGGPQAGVVVGRSSVIAPMQRHPLRRALRPEKSTLVALAATLDAYLTERPQEVPLYRLLTETPEALRRRARGLVRALRRVAIEARIVPTRAVLGGGTTPDQTIPSFAIALAGAEATAAKLRAATPPVIVRVEDGMALVDLRAVTPAQEAQLLAALTGALRG